MLIPDVIIAIFIIRKSCLIFKLKKKNVINDV
jgi:hypothetical protein